MANGFYLTAAAAQAMITALGAQIDAGTAAVIEIYSGTVPVNADAALSGNTLLASLTCNATALSSVSSTGTAARGTFNAIASDTSADATGVATFFRIKTQTGGTVIAQGTVGTSGADMVLNTTSITSGSTVAVSSATIDLPFGP